jgi:perosamine synthetase
VQNIKMEKQYGVGGVILGPKTKEYLMEIIDSNRLTHGKFLDTFEKEFAKSIDVKHAIMCNSGTGALHIAFQMLKEENDWKEGDEVIVPSVTFVATSNVLIHLGLKPVFVDIDSKTYNIDPTKIEDAITEKTKAIVAVHLCGCPADMDPIMDIAKNNNLKVVEDACESMFAKYKGKYVGTMGDVGCYSTYAAHIITTGIGGFMVTNNDEYAMLMNSLMNHGRDPIYLHMDDDKGEDKDLTEIVDKRYKFNRIGHSFRATEMEGAVGLAQLEIKDEILNKREENAKLLISLLEPFKEDLQLPTIPEDCVHVFMMCPIIIKNPNIQKRDLVQFLESKNVETRDLLPLINQKPYVERFGNLEETNPVAKNVNQKGFYIGCHPELEKEDIEYMVSVIKEFLSTSL